MRDRFSAVGAGMPILEQQRTVRCTGKNKCGQNGMPRASTPYPLGGVDDQTAPAAANVRVEVRDYRDLNESGGFDKLVSGWHVRARGRRIAAARGESTLRGLLVLPRIIPDVSCRYLSTLRC